MQQKFNDQINKPSYATVKLNAYLDWNNSNKPLKKKVAKKKINKFKINKNTILTNPDESKISTK